MTLRVNSLKRHIAWTMNCASEVYIDPTSEEERLNIRSPLGPQQMEDLRQLVESYGWHLSYELDNAGFLFLAILPNQVKQKEVAKL